MLVELVCWCVLEDGEQPQLLSGVEVLVVETQQSVDHTVLEWPWPEAKLALLEDLALTLISCEDDASCVLYVPPGVYHEAFTSRLDDVERHLCVGERAEAPNLYFTQLSAPITAMYSLSMSVLRRGPGPL